MKQDMTFTRGRIEPDAPPPGGGFPTEAAPQLNTITGKSGHIDNGAQMGYGVGVAAKSATGPNTPR